jgi:hypothetical protein
MVIAAFVLSWEKDSQPPSDISLDKLYHLRDASEPEQGARSEYGNDGLVICVRANERLADVASDKIGELGVDAEVQIIGRGEILNSILAVRHPSSERIGNVYFVPSVSGSGGGILEGGLTGTQRALEFLIVYDHDHTLSAGDGPLPGRLNVTAESFREVFYPPHASRLLHSRIESIKVELDDVGRHT